jgi:hypothetical protein
MKNLFFKYPNNIKKRLKELKIKSAFYWENLGQRYVDKLIKFIITTTPAYKNF